MNLISQNFQKRHRNHRILPVVLLSVLLMTGAGSLDDWENRFKQANDLYGQGRYQEAALAYEALVSEGASSASLYYNLGNTHFKQGIIGRAVLSYERAIRLAPKDKEILGNLAYAREFVQDKVSGPEPPGWMRRLYYLNELFTLNIATVLCSIFYYFLVLLVCVLILRPDARGALKKGLILSSVLLSFSFSLLGMKLFSERYSEAIVVAREIEVRYGPSPQETKAFVLHEGTSCAIREISGEWVLIWLANDRGGWVPRESLEPI